MSMKRYNFLLAIVVIALAVSACVKDIDVPSGNGEDMFEVAFNLEVEPVTYTMTRAENINADETDEFIDRIDMYEFDKAGDMLRHEVWKDPDGLELTTVNPKSYDSNGNKHTWVFVANLDEDSAEYLAGLNADEMGEMPTGIIPLEAGNFRLHKPVMCGCNYSNFTKNETKTVTLYRYLTRIEISSITADFDDDSLFDKDVKINRIAIVNYPNALRLLDESAATVYGNYQDVLGTGFTIVIGKPAFGNLMEINNDCNDWELNSSYFEDDKGILELSEFGGKGKLGYQYDYIINNNRLAPKGELIIDATGDQLIASAHIFGTDEGILCSSTNSAITHRFDVNKVFYTVPVRRQVASQLYGDIKYQDDLQKLVIEVEIDGTNYFYIISLDNLIAGMIYKVGNINLKSIGSEYSNKYEKLADPLVSASTSMSGVADWSETELSDMNVGYTVDGYDIYGYE